MIVENSKHIITLIDGVVLSNKNFELKMHHAWRPFPHVQSPDRIVGIYSIHKDLYSACYL
jgi:hypothetical protein